jgi:succinate dehydrogenase flavin-adding protein (antitoxin of CptAB toxin-antitoxin module)
VVKQVVQQEVEGQISFEEVSKKITSESIVVAKANKWWTNAKYRKLMRFQDTDEWSWVLLDGAKQAAKNVFDSVLDALKWAADREYINITFCENTTDLIKWLVEQESLSPNDLFTEEELEDALEI